MCGNQSYCMLEPQQECQTGPARRSCLVPNHQVSWVQVKPGTLLSSQLPASLSAATVEDLALRQQMGDDVAAQALAALRCRGVFAGAPPETVQYTTHPQSLTSSILAAIFAGLGSRSCSAEPAGASLRQCVVLRDRSACAHLLLICASAALKLFAPFSEVLSIAQLATNAMM